MVYKRKTSRGSYGEEALRSALASLAEGTPLKAAARQYNIPAKTLRRHRDGKVLLPGYINLGRFKNELNEDYEAELVLIIQQMEKALFGLSTFDVRRLAYDFAEKAGLNHRFNHEKKMAGKDWLRCLLNRHPQLSIRQPEATNLSRAVGFNQGQVQTFYTYYKELLVAHTYDPMRVWNVDETGLSTVQKPVKVLATKGARVVGRITSGERGQTITGVCAMNAAGTFLPPMLIYPRKRMMESLLNGAPPGTVGVCTPSGWTDSECFLRWLQHFVNIVKPCQQAKHIIVLDGHHSHKTYDAVMFARSHGIELITLPPHCTHKMQPLDVSFFRSLKAAYNAAADNWMLSNKGRRITMFEVATIFGRAYMKSASVDKAVVGFQRTGLWPFNDAVFQEEDFVAAQLTDEPMPTLHIDGASNGQLELQMVPEHQQPEMAPRQPEGEYNLMNQPETAPWQPEGVLQSSYQPEATTRQPEGEDELMNQPASVPQQSEEHQSTYQPETTPLQPEGEHELMNQSETSSRQPEAECVTVPATADLPTGVFYGPTVSPGRLFAQTVLKDLCGPIKAVQERKRTRKPEKATVLTSSPYKKLLEQKGKDKLKSRKRSDKGLLLQKAENKKRKLVSSKKEKKKMLKRSSGNDNVGVRCICGVLEGSENDNDSWIKCNKCDKWLHERCAEVNGIFDDDFFYCSDKCMQ